MRIHVTLCGYHDWKPCPPGTEITEADIKNLDVKQMSDDAWHMKVKIDRDTHFDFGPSEVNICQRMAALVAVGKSDRASRQEAVMRLCDETFPHHFGKAHVVKIEVHDDGPDVELYKAALAQAGVTDQAAIDAAVDAYDDEEDIEAFLNAVYVRKPKAKKAKVQP